MTLDQMLDDLLAREGGYIDHSADRGGATNYGITRATLSAWRGKPVSIKDVQALTENEAREIYTVRYYAGAQVDKLPAKLQPPMFDACVNHGAGNAWRMLQRACNGLGCTLQTDGVPGIKTFEAVTYCNVDKLCAAFVAERRKFYERIVAADASQQVFLRGWLNRLSEFS